MIGRWWRRLRARLRYRHFDAELRREIEVHRAMHEDALRAAGHDAAAARAAAARRLGNLTAAREDARAVWLPTRLESVAQDLRYGLRSLRRQPSFTIPALLILFLAIGVNVAVFTFLSVFMRPWPVGDPGMVVDVQPRATPGVSMPEYEHLRASARTVSSLAGRDMQYARVGVPGAPADHGPIEFVSANFFSTLQLPVTAGRDFSAGDDRAGAPAAVAIVSELYWDRRFARDAAALGRTITIDGKLFVIVGVAAPGFTGVSPGYHVDVWVPLATRTIVRPYDARERQGSPCCVSVAARLRDDVPAAEVQAELDTLSRAFRKAAGVEGGGVVVRATGGLPGSPATAMTMVSAILAAPIAILALACANVGNLQLARNLRRRSEIAMRLSLGASRGRISRQLLTEGLLLAGFAGSAGLLIAFLLPSVLPVIIDLLDESDVFPFHQFVPDWRVVLFTIGVCGFACVVFALVPALTVTRMGVRAVAAGRHGAEPAAARLRTILMGAQIAVTTALLAIAGLLSRGVIEAARIDPGFDTRHVYVGTVSLPSDLATEARTRAMLDGLATASAQSPAGPIGFAGIEPLSRAVPEARITTASGATTFAEANRASRSFFAILGIPLVAGRWFDDRTGSREVIVNETFARLNWPSSAPLGQTFLVDDQTMTYEVVGVVRDTRQTRLDRVTPMYFAPIRSSQKLIVRTPAADVEARLAAFARGIDPDARVQVAPLAATVRRQLSDTIEMAAVAWAVGLTALLLAAIGIYGVFSFVVEERRREIGVRLALGASRVAIQRVLFGSVRAATLGGATTGVLCAAAAASVLRSQLYGISAIDPVAFAAVAALLVMTAVVATAIPARRAARIDPAISLRQE